MKRLHFPNMVQDHAMFTIDHYDGNNYELRIFNISGEEVYSRELDDKCAFMFDRGNLIGGVYFIQVTNSKKEVVYMDTLILY